MLYHGILSQNAFTLTLVTPRLPRTFRAGKHRLEYHQVKRPLFRGYADQGGVLVAEPEKALLDLIYIRLVRGGKMDEARMRSLLDDMHLDELDRRKLARYAGWFDGATREVVEGMIGE
jgi:hypothetical protein